MTQLLMPTEESSASAPLNGANPSSPEEFEARAAQRTRFAKIAAAVLGVLVIGGGACVPIGGAVIASAEVGPETQIKRVAHPPEE
mgnify:CR=1 FL=1